MQDDIKKACDEVIQFDNMQDLTREYNLKLREILDKHAPLITRIIVCRPYDPSYGDDIRSAKQEQRKVERV